MPPLTQSKSPGSDGARETGTLDIRRRDALKFLASGLAFTLAGCSRPRREILPYIDMPEALVAGEPSYYATALPLAGYARGVIVEAVDGRPIKIAGNPRHPASLGATDIFAEAEILSLYDPDRSRAPRGPQPVSTWNALLGALQQRREHWDKDDGAGLRLVTGRVTSPTMLRQIDGLLKKHPGARWHAYEPAEGDISGRLAPKRPDLSKAKIIVSLDADPLGPGPDQIANARGFAQGRKPQAEGGVSRLYVVESTRTLTGANADHRLALDPRRIGIFAKALSDRLAGKQPGTEDLPEAAKTLLDSITEDLSANPGRSVLLAGETLTPEARRVIDAMNGEAAASSSNAGTESPDIEPAALDALWSDLDAGKITDLVMIGCNPVHDFPDPAIEDAIEKIGFAVHAGTHQNESGRVSKWYLPLSHMLESWGDLAAGDGTVSIVQPLIRPLYATRSAVEILGLLSGDVDPSDHDIVRDTWRNGRSDADFEEWWREALIAGVVGNVDGSAGLLANASAAAVPAEDAALGPSGDEAEGALTAVIRPDPTIYDGGFSNNAWLQECPKPISKHTWSNVVGLSAVDAQKLGVADGDVVTVKSAGGSIEGSAYVDSGQANGVVGLTLGYGRTRSGAIGTGLGFNARALSPRRLTATVESVSVSATGRKAPVPSTQNHFRLEGEFESLMPQVTAKTDFRLDRSKRKKAGESFLHFETEGDGYRWAMVIDSAACIGCHACVVACQSENNIPVVGPEEVANQRIMHWLRIDRYERDEGPESISGFEPVPCMQCQKAPCEPVCPVEASVHDVEGLNDQVYNRCVGTRFCQSNCPYKVRRFNWFAYNSGQEYANLGNDPMPAQKNPNVTVRARGVMEKCTYCVQRISRARHEAIKTDEPIEDGGVVTACQQACPTQAISFGNLADPKSQVSRLKHDQRHFTLLEELGTEPRTTYLARIRNIADDFAGDAS